MADIPYHRHPMQVSNAVASLAAIVGRPTVLAAACVVTLTAFGWLYLGWAIGHMLGADDAGARASGAGLLDLIAAGRWDVVGRQAVNVLCLPMFDGGAGRNGVAGADAASSVVECAFVLAMWGAMALAMMLPSAAPMILTYAEIGEAAARKGDRIVSPLVLTAGYLSVWLGFALVAALVQLLLVRVALTDGRMASASALLSGGTFVAAGLYQFSALKHACLTQCRRPFPFFFMHWSTETRKIFRLGVQQGLFCLGCCWAMMLVMFAVGTMNIVWMAFIGALMALEKIATTTRVSRAAGIAFFAIGLLFLAAAGVDRWPT